MTLSFEEWAEDVPESLKRDALWSLRIYQFALYLGSIAWEDVSLLSRDGRTRGIADQMYRAVGSISANVAEGYSRRTGKDRARFFEYALGSAREARTWYYQGLSILGEQRVHERFRVLESIIRMLLAYIPSQRGHNIAEDPTPYSPTPHSPTPDSPTPDSPTPHSSTPHSPTSHSPSPSFPFSPPSHSQEDGL